MQVFHGRGDTAFLVSCWNNYRQQFQVITFCVRRHNAAEMSNQLGLASASMAMSFRTDRNEVCGSNATPFAAAAIFITSHLMPHSQYSFAQKSSCPMNPQRRSFTTLRPSDFISLPERFSVALAIWPGYFAHPHSWD